MSCAVLILLFLNSPLHWEFPPSMTEREVNVIMRASERCAREYLVPLPMLT